MAIESKRNAQVAEEIVRFFNHLDRSVDDISRSDMLNFAMSTLIILILRDGCEGEVLQTLCRERIELLDEATNVTILA